MFDIFIEKGSYSSAKSHLEVVRTLHDCSMQEMLEIGELESLERQQNRNRRRNTFILNVPLVQVVHQRVYNFIYIYYFCFICFILYTKLSRFVGKEITLRK